MNAGEVLSKFAADISGYTRGLTEMQAKTGIWKAQVGMLAAAAAAALVAGAIAVGVAAVKMAGDFQQGLTQLVTSAGEVKSNLGMVGSGILSLAISTATSTKQLISGMYMIESAGFHGAAGLLVLKAAAMGARAENADLGTVANAVTSALNAYGLGASQAANVTNILVAATSRGKMHMQDLAQAIATVLPTASAARVSLRDVAAALATMTSQGTNAAQAGTYLKQMLIALEAPSKAGKALLESLGLTTQQIADKMKVSLPGALQMITDALAKKFPVGSAAYMDAIKQISGGSRTMQGMLELTGSHLKTFQGNVEGITSSVKKGAGGITGWAEIQGNFNFKMGQAKEVAEAFMITLGSALIPVILSLIDEVGNLVAIGASIISFFKNSQLACDILIGGIAGLTAMIIAMNIGAIAGFIVSIPAIVGGFLAWAAAAGVAAVATLLAAAPFIAIGLVVAAVVVGIILAIQHWGAISKWLQGAWQATVAWFNTALHTVEQFFVNIWHGIQTVTSTVWGAILGFLQGVLAHLIAIFTAPFTAIGALFVWLYNHNTYFKQLIDTITNVVKGGLAWLQGAWTNTINFVVGLWNYIKAYANMIWSALVVIITGHVTSAKSSVMSTFNSVASFLTGIWNGIKTGVTNTWNTVVSIFQGIWGRVSGPVNTMKNNLVNWAANLAASAITWGANLVQRFIDGLLSKLGDLLNAAANLAGQVAKALGFHSPTEYGPGRFADTWAPNFVNMYIQGLLAGIPRLRAAAAALAGALPQGLAVPVGVTGGGTSASSSGGSSRMIDLLERLIKAVEAGQVIAIDGDIMAAALGPRLAAERTLRYGRLDRR